MPRVSIIVPTKPGQAEIKSVTAARRLDYPRDKIQILVARGQQPAVQRNHALRAADADDNVRAVIVTGQSIVNLPKPAPEDALLWATPDGNLVTSEVNFRRMLRDRLYNGLKDIEEVYVNGDLTHRIPHNLNISFNYVEGESLIMAVKDIAVSSGSACTSASLEPSYVLRALGRSDELAHSSIRFSIGRFTTEADVDFTIQLLKDKIEKLRELSPLWEMFKDGIDISKVEWAAH